jgi:hypothetical protein
MGAADEGGRNMQAVAARFNAWQQNTLCLAGVVIVGMIAYPPWLCEPRGHG